MSNRNVREPAGFGKRSEPHTILVTRNGRSRKFTINPVVFTLATVMFALLLFCYLTATAYLVFRDDLIGATYSRTARMQHEYEDRIAALRSRLDRVTSRQLLDQQAIENKVAELLERQQRIGNQGNGLSGLLERARQRGLGSVSGAVPVPQINPAKTSANSKTDAVTTGSIVPETPQPELQENASLMTSFTLRGVEGELPAISAERANPVVIASLLPATKTAGMARPLTNTAGLEMGTLFTRELFGEVAQSIGEIDTRQRNEVDALRIAAARKTKKIARVLADVGAPLPGDINTDIGGPFIPLDHSVAFQVHLEALEDALQQLDEVARIATALPLSSPAPGARISSRFGHRKDPFNGRIAMHSGIDFKAKRGTPVVATGDGIVIKAERNGGYGKMVEIRHKGGYITRYAHLSRMTVRVGERVKAGDKVGKVGSTGRSTGPHLHYEVRKGKKAINPSPMLHAGSKLRGLI